MDRPDADTVRATLPSVTWAVLGYDGVALDPVVEMANAYVEAMTGRTLDSSMPETLDDIALQAVALRTVQLAYAFQGDRIESLTEEGIQSFSVPGYSETRRDPTVAWKLGMVNAWPMLHELLWLLMTDEKRDEWRETMNNVTAPAFAVSEVDWDFASKWRDWEQP